MTTIVSYTDFIQETTLKIWTVKVNIADSSQKKVKTVAKKRLDLIYCAQTFFNVTQLPLRVIDRKTDYCIIFISPKTGREAHSFFL